MSDEIYETVKLKELLRQLAYSQIDLVNDGECCMRIPADLIVRARVMSSAVVKINVETKQETKQELPIDTKVEVLIGNDWKKRYLLKVCGEGVEVFHDGKTSWSSDVYEDNSFKVMWYKTWQVWKDDSET